MATLPADCPGRVCLGKRVLSRCCHPSGVRSKTVIINHSSFMDEGGTMKTLFISSR